ALQDRDMGNAPQKQPQEKQEEELCEICMEPMLSKLRFKNSNKCCHPFCMDCIAKYINATLEDNLAKIQCPALKCEELLDPFSCKPIISTKLFDKWCDILRDSALQGIQKCYCPYRDCSILILNECGDVLKRSQCPNCKRLFCFECKMQWHTGYGCGEMKEMTDRNDILFAELVETKRWTRCFHCGHAVELVEGCSLVRCRFSLTQINNK
ncbi:IBR domain-containing protein, partial [Cephalotus follicularis]